MRFIGIDAGITTTGICILQEDGTYEPIEVTIPHQYKEGSDFDRFTWLRHAIESAIRPGKEKTMYMLEDYAMWGKGQITRIAEFTGMLKNTLCRYQRNFLNMQTHGNYHIFVCSPNTLKKFATGAGKGKKSLILKAVYKKWEFDTDSDDLADAFVLAKMCQELFTYMIIGGIYKAKLKYEHECMVAILKQNKIDRKLILS